MAGCEKEDTTPDDFTFVNPLLDYGPDPWVIQKDSFYYYTNTLSNRIELWKTKSISRLNAAERKVIWYAPATGINSNNIWAPELHYLNEKWYIYYTAGPTIATGNQRMFVLENSSPDPMEGTWIDKGKIADSTADFFALDATVFEYNNKKYLLWSSTETPATPDQNIYCAELKNPWTLAGKRTLLSEPIYNWERFEAPAAKGVNEGPQILKNAAGRIFMVYSASECWTDGYGLGMMSLADGADPMVQTNWTKRSTPVFATQRLSNAYGPGHNAFFKSPDGKEDWIIYHANSEARQFCGGFRSPRMQRFTWKDDGNPDFGTPLPIFVKINRPSGEKD